MNIINMYSAKKMLFEYVKDPTTLFYWYHNPERIYLLNTEAPEKENLLNTEAQEKETKWNKTWKNENYHRQRLRKNNFYVITNHEDPQKDDIVIHKDLNAFFEATLDEVRLKNANDFSKYALWISGNRPLAYFRKAASKREIAADIDFNMQRDHAVHTLYNYILGWYLFDNSLALQKAFRKNIGCDNTEQSNEENFYKEPGHSFFMEKSKLNNLIQINPEKKFISINLTNEFGDVWCITSLLHDIGYILEGTLSSASTEVENVRVIRGSKVVHDYFNHWFWEKCRVDFRAAQEMAKLLDVSIPDFKNSQSLASLGDRLCDIGSCENIRKNLVKTNLVKTKDEEEEYFLNREAFSIWGMYYRKTNKEKMKRILEIVREEYYDAMWSGYNQGYRNLNHGVCSGLIILQALTFYHEFIWGFELIDWGHFDCKQHKENDQTNGISKTSYDETKKRIEEKFFPKEMSIRSNPKPDFWFNKVLWATSSIAIHDVIQQGHYKQICKKYDPEKEGETVKIKIDDDPLAFLGVLVDALEEWDRYTISGDAAFSKKTEPLQGTDIDIEFESEEKPINFYYPVKGGEEKDFASDIEKTLNDCLDGWKTLIGIGRKFSCPDCGLPLKIYLPSSVSGKNTLDTQKKHYRAACERAAIDDKFTDYKCKCPK